MFIPVAFAGPSSMSGLGAAVVLRAAGAVRGAEPAAGGGGGGGGGRGAARVRRPVPGGPAYSTVTVPAEPGERWR